MVLQSDKKIDQKRVFEKFGFGVEERVEKRDDWEDSFVRLEFREQLVPFRFAPVNSICSVVFCLPFQFDPL